MKTTLDYDREKAATDSFGTCKVYKMELQNNCYPFPVAIIIASTSRNAIFPPGGWSPIVLEGLSPPAGPPLPMPEVKLGVNGHLEVGEDT